MLAKKYEQICKLLQYFICKRHWISLYDSLDFHIWHHELNNENGNLHILRWIRYYFMILLVSFCQATEEATELATVRNQCIRLLGRLGGSINNLLVTQSLKQKSKTAVAWDTEKHLKFNIPFIDLKPTIYFGRFSLSSHITYHFTLWLAVRE